MQEASASCSSVGGGPGPPSFERDNISIPLEQFNRFELGRNFSNAGSASLQENSEQEKSLKRLRTTSSSSNINNDAQDCEMQLVTSPPLSSAGKIKKTKDNTFDPH